MGGSTFYSIDGFCPMCEVRLLSDKCPKCGRHYSQAQLTHIEITKKG